MCIAVLSTAHPAYRLALINNRDEFLNRPTSVANWWPEPHQDVLGGRDLLRTVQGTWLGVAKNGKIAVLTNYRDEGPVDPTAISRGAIIKQWLTEDFASTEDFSTQIVETEVGKTAGGFSLICGRMGEKLAVISNRAQHQAQVPWILGDTVQTIGLSNTTFDNRTWKKVRDGEELMLDAIQQSIHAHEDEQGLLDRFFNLLSTDTLPRVSNDEGAGINAYVKELRNTIFVPTLGRKDVSSLSPSEIASARKSETVEVLQAKGSTAPPPTTLGVSGLYGTQKQTVILVDHDMNIRFVERTLFDENSDPIPRGQGDVSYRFTVA